MLNSIQDAVNSLLPLKRKVNSASGWISFNAPCCVHNGESPDKRGRGGLVTNPDGGVSYHCFNCNFKASYVPGRHLTYKFRKLLSWFGADENTVKRLVIDAIRIKDLIDPEALAKVVEKEEVTFKARPLPAEALSLEALYSYHKLANTSAPDDLYTSAVYLAGRHVDLNKYQFYWTPEKQYNLNKRVIIPYTWKNEIIGYTARTFNDDIKPKYHNMNEPNYVFNTDKQLPDSKFVIVVEGPFDAMAVDGVAILSNECSEVQADIIDSLGKEVILVPDFDTKIVKNKEVWAGGKLIDQAIEYGWSVSFPAWRDKVKDTAKAVEVYGKLFVIKSILEAKESSRLKINLMKKRI